MMCLSNFTSPKCDAFRSCKEVGLFLRELFTRFNDNEIQYCVLHSYDKLPDFASSDVDMAIDSSSMEAAERIIFKLSEDMKMKVIQRLLYDIPRCYFYVIFFRDEKGFPGFIQLEYR